MSFLAPQLLFGLLLAGIPIAIHLIGKKRAPMVDFSAYDFLEELVQRLARREQLRQLLLLLLRIAIVALLALALAGPGVKSLLAATEKADTLIVVDASRSMSYTLGSQTLFTRAKAKAHEILASHPDGLSLVVVAQNEPKPLSAQPTADRQALGRALDDVTPGRRGADVAAAVRSGLELFQGRSVDVFIVSDLSENVLGAAEGLDSKNIRRLSFVDVAERPRPLRALPNLAVSALSVEHLPDGGHRVLASVHNFGASESEGELRLQLDDAVKARAFVQISPGSSVEREFTLTDLQKGLHRGQLILSAKDDGFRFDDVAPVAVEVFDEPKVLVVNGDPKSVRFRDELFYLERALQVAEPPIAFDTIAADDLATHKLEPYQVLVLANVSAPTATLGEELSAFVKRGGGLFVALGDRVSFEGYNSALGDVLPARLRDQWSVADPKAQDAPIHALGLTDISWAHPIFRRFDEQSETGFTLSHTFRHFFVEAEDLSARATQLVRFTSGAPALLERRSGAREGRVLLWTSTLDRDWSDLAIRPPFSPLVAQIVRYAGGSLRTAPDKAFVTFTESELVLPVGVSEAALVRTDARDQLATLNRPVSAFTFAEPGLYALSAGGATIPGTMISVRESLEESDFTPVQPDDVVQRLRNDNAELSVEWGSSPVDSSDFRGYAHLLLIALVLVFGAQSLLASRG